nr:hypothetical protein [uncultured Marinifilum sp.]
MKKILSILYTLATVLIIVGALFILQSETYGIVLLTCGLGLNIVYRILNLNWTKVKEFHIMSLLKLMGIIVMGIACVLIFSKSDQRFNILILSIVLDLVLNSKEISFRTK